jgi:hypothetical protein
MFRILQASVLSKRRPTRFLFILLPENVLDANLVAIVFVADRSLAAFSAQGAYSPLDNFNYEAAPGIAD